MSEPSIKKVLVIDDSADYRQLFHVLFKKACPTAEIDDYDPTWGKPPATFPWARYELLILDYDLGSGENGLDWLRNYKTSKDFPPTIMLTAQDGDELVVKAQRYGAQSFLRKEGLTKEKLLESIKHALEKYREETEKANEQKIRVHVYNKGKFFQSLAQAKKNDAVFLIEIDKYQALRESLGIFATDKFASFISESISKFITDSKYDGYMTRIGDSTVAMLIQNVQDNTEEIAKKLCEYFNKLDYQHEGKKVSFSVNIGAICIDVEKVDVANILARIEAACRQAREKPGNSYVISGNIAENEDKVDQQAYNNINDAIKENRIQPLFQVLVLVSDSALNAKTEFYQTRANLLDPDNNIIEAKDFIPVMQKTNLLKAFDRWIIRYCISELAKLNKKNGCGVGLFIMLSEQSLNDHSLTDWISKLIEYVKMPKLGASLVFEIDAKCFHEHLREAKLQINKLRVKFGAKIALTHVQGSSMLDGCLQQEKFDYIIFSPQHIDEGKMNQKDILEITNLAKGHNALTIASKIESGDYLGMSASAGVDYVLGYFVQPPMENIVATEIVEV